VLSAQVLEQIHALPVAQQVPFLALIEEQEEATKLLKARESFLGFVEYSWPAFVYGRHHGIIANAFDRIISGDLKRLIITLGPRFTKSKFSSFLLPAKYIGHYPDRKIIQTSHTAELAVGFGREVRNLVATKEYRKLFPNTVLKADSKAAGRWNTSKGGEYFAIGVGGAVAGKGADLLIMDDIHSERDFIRALGGDTSAFDEAFTWYQTGPRQRLQPSAAILILITRWHQRDIVGRLTKRMTSGTGKEQWEIIEFPAILNGKSMWPEYWPTEELLATKEELSPQQWNAQYLQAPTSEESALVKREWWNIWDRKEPPECEFIIQAWDTAFLKTQTADYSACTTWGIFNHPNEYGITTANIILLDAFKERLEFPSLKKKAQELYTYWKPDATIIEGKASGMPLIFELRAMGIPVADYTPVRGTKANPNDKISRLNGISDLFASGMVWRPDTRWAEEVAEEVAGAGDNDDLADTTVMALMRFRQGGFIRLESDETDEPKKRRIADYY